MRSPRGAARYGPSTPRTSVRAPPCIWTFLSSLRKSGFLSNLFDEGRGDPSGFSLANFQLPMALSAKGTVRQAGGQTGWAIGRRSLSIPGLFAKAFANNPG